MYYFVAVEKYLPLIYFTRLADLRIIAVIKQSLDNSILMLVSEGLHRDRQLHRTVTVDADKLVMLQTDDIALGLRDNACHIDQLARTIGQKYGYGEYAAALDQSVLYDRGYRNNVHIPSA